MSECKVFTTEPTYINGRKAFDRGYCRTLEKPVICDGNMERCEIKKPITLFERIKK